MSKIVRSAKTGRFVDRDEAERNPAQTITQRPARLTEKTAKLIAEKASMYLGRPIDAATVQAVVRAHRQMKRGHGNG
jgi:hypothetical protein